MVTGYFSAQALSGFGPNGRQSLRSLVQAVRDHYSKVEYGGGTFVALGKSGSISALTNSSTPLVWTHGRSGVNTELSGLGFGRGVFLALSKGSVLVSPGGLVWDFQGTGHSSQLYDVAFGKNTFVAVGENGTILQSGVFPDDIRVRILGSAVKDGFFETSVQTERGREYVLEFKNALDEPVWTALPAAPGNGSMLQLADTNALAGQRFYRVRIR